MRRSSVAFLLFIISFVLAGELFSSPYLSRKTVFVSAGPAMGYELSNAMFGYGGSVKFGGGLSEQILMYYNFDALAGAMTGGTKILSAHQLGLSYFLFGQSSTPFMRAGLGFEVDVDKTSKMSMNYGASVGGGVGCEWRFIDQRISIAPEFTVNIGHTGQSTTLRAAVLLNCIIVF
jgi:hypothetical protein